jgi:hypothetical protein
MLDIRAPNDIDVCARADAGGGRHGVVEFLPLVVVRRRLSGADWMRMSPVSTIHSRLIYDALKACDIRLLSAFPETWLVHLVRMPPRIRR